MILLSCKGMYEMNNTAYKKGRQYKNYSKSKQKNTLESFLSLLFLPLFLIISEFLLKISLFGSISFKELVYLFLFSVSAGLLITLFCRLFACGVAKLSENRHVIRPLTAVLIGICTAVFTVLFVVQYLYFSFFGDFFKWSTLDMAGGVAQFYREILATMASGWYWILLFILPTVLYFLFAAKRMPSSYIRPANGIVLLCVALLCHFSVSAIINLDDEDYGDKTYYTEIFNAPYAVKSFGLIAETRLDIKQLLFGDLGGESVTDDTVPPINQLPDVLLGDESNETEQDETPQAPVEYGYNIMDIDFDSLISSEKNSTIKSMHSYFSQLEGTKQNKYTGYFKGKNLIFITLEGFSHKAIIPELTPTLYKMATEGFVFTNFYNSLWGGSTATGEYAVLTGNFYDSAKVLEMSADTYQPFVLGNQLSALNYKTTAYHNHSHTYYTRNKSHPNFGYEWIAIGNGLELPTSAWPRSDYEMALVTSDDYIRSEPFHTYYMTVSGHALYTFAGNSMSQKHRIRVESLTQYSENVRAYIACNLEVEDMLTELMDKLKAAGTLDNTVFVIAEDHYPYALEKSEIAELYGLPNDDNLFSNFDLYRNFFTVYSTSMKEPITVDEPCSAIDILPTVLNLFGIEYDSRLISGSDILSDTPNTVILNCDQTGPSWNWITRYGSYNTKTKKFTPGNGVSFASEQAQQEYVDSMNKLVRLKRNYSHLIIEEDYYRHVFK